MMTSTLTRTVAVDEQLIQIKTRGVVLEGTLVMPHDASSIAIFVQTDGSCRLNPRNHYLAHFLRQYGLATLLVDLTTREEQMVSDRAESLHCDLGTLAMRLVEVTDWLQQAPHTQHLQVGYLGLQGNGSHVAFLAATERHDRIKAIVAPNSNLETIELALPHVKAPTLLVVGGMDDIGIKRNKRSLRLLPSGSEMAIVPRSDSQFREARNLEFIGQLTSQWFHKLDAPAEPEEW